MERLNILKKFRVEPLESVFVHYGEIKLKSEMMRIYSWITCSSTMERLNPKNQNIKEDIRYVCSSTMERLNGLDKKRRASRYI